MEVVALLSQGRTAAAQCGLFTYKSVPVIFEPPCTSCGVSEVSLYHSLDNNIFTTYHMLRYVLYDKILLRVAGF